MTKEQLAKRISDLALLRGEFTLRSGRKSNYYLDKYRFETQPDVLKALGKMLAERVTNDIDRLAGPELGAVALAAAAAIESGKPFVLVRNRKKEYGTSKQIEGVLNKGERVLIIEDVLTTGGQVLESVASLREAGGGRRADRGDHRPPRRRPREHRRRRIEIRSALHNARSGRRVTRSGAVP